MIVEFALAVNLAWVSPQGDMKSESVDEMYVSHKACTDDLYERIRVVKLIHGVSPVPLGTELCTPVKVPTITDKERAELKAWVKRMSGLADEYVATLREGEGATVDAYGDLLSKVAEPQTKARVVKLRDDQLLSLKKQAASTNQFIRDLRTIQLQTQVSMRRVRELIDDAKSARKSRDETNDAEDSARLAEVNEIWQSVEDTSSK